MRITQRAIDANTLPVGRHTDESCPSLLVWVKRTGTTAYVQRLVVNGKRVEKGLGGARFVRLAEAREQAAANRLAARRGNDPFSGRAEARRAAGNRPTFGQAAEAARKANEAAWGDGSRIKWASTINAHLGAWADRPVADITPADVVDLLAGKTAATGRHCRRVIRTAFEAAIVAGWTDRNPAVGIDGMLPTMRRAETTPRPAADCSRLPAIFGRLAEAADSASDCLRLVMLTWCRSAEARGMTWDEVDLDTGLWTLPADRAKNGKVHVSPLSAPAVAILRKRADRAGTGRGLVFRGAVAGRPLSAEALNRRLAADEGCVHGLRACGATWAAEAGYPAEVHQGQLNHVRANGNAVQRAYDRSSRLADRRAMMDAWGARLAAGR